MTGTERIWITRRDYVRLHNELAALRSRRSIEVPDDLMDYDANLVAGYAARRARICEIQDLLTNAVVGEDAVGARIAEPGMVLTIRYDASGETETFLLGRRFGEGADVTVYSTLSPLGHAIAGARPGEQRIYPLPDERGRLVTLLEAVPYEMYVAKNPGHRPPPRRNGDPRAPETTTTTDKQPKRSRRQRHRVAA
ncbi:transcription elongation factor GreA [Mycobacterium seoulense]|uniref:GreA/GreB family elongation factor n=1 Tax=Mycobacterium seoulense TaxID=386911 RepID=UPI003CF3A647